MIIGIYGFQDAGKTTLVEDVVRRLAKKGYSVASVKHSPHRKSVDCEGKDTWRHWKAGSDPVVFASEVETAFIKHRKLGPEDITRILGEEFRPDVIVMEGFKEGPFPKVAVGDLKPRMGTVLMNPKAAEIVEYIEAEVSAERTLAKLPGLDCRKCGLDCDGLARAIASGKRRLEDCKELPSAGVSIAVDGKRIPMGRFASSIVNDTIRGMLGSLKCYEHGKDVEIRLEAKSAPPRRRR
ncbi:MAG: molybdopterin-guanine dinucleotide biosynthesis protein B [Euryarchaeota archaeon RBG_16_62_10]|nr:MAG: molybdopterin-guanine dinucleotide biosynthesis protein B [Euryarchaeota archaeon RBG_16_62_10]